MHQDTNGELERLNKVLQEENEPVPAEETASIYNTDELDADLEALSGEPVLAEETVSIYNTDKVDADLEALSEAVRAEKKESLTGWLITIIVLSTAILGVLLYWIIRYRSLFL